MREWIMAGWLGLSESEKSAVVGAVVAAVLGVFLGLVTLLPKWLVWRYKVTLCDLEDTEESLRVGALSGGVQSRIDIDPNLIFKYCGHSRWFIKRALKWERVQGKPSKPRIISVELSSRLRGRF
jgi:hypothetical protein